MSPKPGLTSPVQEIDYIIIPSPPQSLKGPFQSNSHIRQEWNRDWEPWEHQRSYTFLKLAVWTVAAYYHLSRFSIRISLCHLQGAVSCFHWDREAQDIHQSPWPCSNKSKLQWHPSLWNPTSSIIIVKPLFHLQDEKEKSFKASQYILRQSHPSDLVASANVTSWWPLATITTKG